MIFAIAVFAPLCGALVSGLLGRFIGDRAAMAVAILGMVIAAICGPLALFQLVAFDDNPPGVMLLGSWVDVARFHVNWALRYDALSATMVGMVTFVSMLIHVYSVGYMAHDHMPKYRFFAFLSLFTFAMLMLVTSNDLLQLFFGWEGVGLCSYLLIGYWYDRPAANAAAIKAMIVNRIGDLAFVVGIALIFYQFGSVEFPTIFAAIGVHMADTYHLFGTNLRTFEVIGFLLFFGAMGKSAQIGLHVWLPDAMEGPTPVSGLIHAATMVTAGVFLMARMSPLMEFAPVALAFVTLIGGTTCLFAATIGCAQNDIKKVVAYSTCSQLGYMFLAAGVGAFQVSIFHLICHAFFKALLFLCCGSVIHAMSDEQDMRKMGGIWKKVPITYVTMWFGSLALAAIFPFSGYYSKDAILEAAFADGSGVALYGWICGTLAAALTAFYSWRLLLITFHGKPRFDQHVMDHVHESPWVMTGPLMVLAAGALFAGMLLHGAFIGPDWQQYWGLSIFNAPNNHIMHNMEDVPRWAALLPLLLALCGIATAYWWYVFQPTMPARMAARFPAVYQFLLNKWYFDELYDRVFVQPTFRLSRFLWQTGDAGIIDGMPNGVASLAAEGSREVVKLQTGSLALYAFVMLIGVVALITVFLVMR